MNCKKCRTLIFEYRDGTLSPRQKAEVEAHLETCPACRAEYETEADLAADLKASYKAATDTLTFNPSLVHPPAEFSRTRRARPLYWTAAGAGAAIVAIVLLLGSFNPTKRGSFPTPALEARLAQLQTDDLADPLQDWLEKRMIITVDDKAAGTREKYLTDRTGTVRRIDEQGKN
jgi:anti-sigma factor RsiW